MANPKEEIKMKNYLKEKINNWYKNSEIDYGIEGSFINCIVDGHNLIILFEEEGKKYRCLVSWYTEYTAEQIYNIWMETDWEEVA